MPNLLVIGGDGPKEEKSSYGPPKKSAKPRTMIGGDEEPEAEAEEEEGPGMDMEAQKLEAAKMLFPDNPKRAAKALEAFIYACKE